MAPPPVDWQQHAGSSTRLYRVTCLRLHARRPGVSPWTERLTRLVNAINTFDAMMEVEKEILNDGDDCYDLAAEEAR